MRNSVVPKTICVFQPSHENVKIIISSIIFFNIQLINKTTVHSKTPTEMLNQFSPRISIPEGPEYRQALPPILHGVPKQLLYYVERTVNRQPGSHPKDSQNIKKNRHVPQIVVPPTLPLSFIENYTSFLKKSHLLRKP